VSAAEAFTGAEPGVQTRNGNGAFTGAEPGVLNGHRPSLPPPPEWWSEADEAEWQLLLYEFVGAAWAHRTCTACQQQQGWCEPLAECWAGLLEWREGRTLRAKATWLRACEVAQ
jgi:hypothetical protein